MGRVHHSPHTLSPCPYNTNNSNQPMLKVNCNGSASIWTLKVNPLTGSVGVRWFNSPLTEYKHKASRRAILSLLLSGDRSLGQWVNHNCLQRHETIGLNWRPVFEQYAQQTVALVSTK